jgi:Kef-type K+ transport system membrane component KefB
MNNKNLKIELDLNTLKQVLQVLAKAQVLIYGVAVVAIFGFTAYSVNQALNAQPASAQSVIQPLPKISFNNKTMSQLKSLNNVGGSVPLGSLGTNNPF